MNKILLLALILLTLKARAQELEASSEVVDPMSTSEDFVDAPEEPATEVPEPIEPVQEVPVPEGPAYSDEEEPEPMEESKATAEEPIPVVEAAPAPVAPAPMPENLSAFKVEEETPFFSRQSHWVVSFGFEGMEYELPFDFVGAREKFGEEKRKLYGGRMGFGREFYLGWGFNTTTKLEGFYMGTLFESAKTAAPEETTETFSFSKKTGHIYGGEAVQSIGFLFNMATKNPFMDEMTYLTVEPYIEAGIGRARSYNRLNYHFDTGPANVQEDYQHRIEDTIVSQRIGAGINFTSSTGYFLYLKASQHRYDVTKRREKIYSQPDDAAPVDINRTLTDVDTEPFTIYALGGGYKF